VTSELWLIDAVAATVPARQLERLAGRPGIVSIVRNKRVQAAAHPVSEGSWPVSVDVGADQLHGAFLPAQRDVRDAFNAVSYGGNNGSEPWSGDWQELGEGNGPWSGVVQVGNASTAGLGPASRSFWP
jgi:hypothetical protein